MRLPSLGLPAWLLLGGLGALAPAAARAGLAEERGLAEAEATFCQAELAQVENRLRIFRAQQLPPAEQRRRNAGAEANLADCRRRYQEQRRADAEEEQVRAEAARRLPATAGEVQRAQAERAVRLERARAKPRAALREDERRLLAEEEARLAHEREERARSEDPSQRRPALSALLCLHDGQLARDRAERDEIQRLAALGGGDSQRLYYLRTEIHRLEENASAERAALSGLGGPLACGEPRVAALERCAGLGDERARATGDCSPDDLRDLARALAR